MTNYDKMTTETRIIQFLDHLQIERAHVVGRLAGDWLGLLATAPARIASLTALYPLFLPTEAHVALGNRCLIFASDAPGQNAQILAMADQLSTAHWDVVAGYSGLVYDDILVDCGTRVQETLHNFLQALADDTIPLINGHDGEQGAVAGITYHIRGEGIPLLLFPLGLAPSGWEPLLAPLSEHYCTITLGGAALGIMPALEARGATGSYQRMMANLFAAMPVQPGQSILDVGCGSGAANYTFFIGWPHHCAVGTKPS